MAASLLVLGLVVAALGPAMALFKLKPNRPATPAMLALGYAPPAVFLLLCLVVAQGGASRFRFALVGHGLRASTEGQGFTSSVGGDAEEDDVWVSNFSSDTRLGTLAFLPDPSGDPDAGGSITVEVDGARGGLLRVGSRDLIREVELAPGDVLQVQGTKWTYERTEPWFGMNRDRFTSEGGAVVELPLRFGQLPFLGLDLPIVRPLGVGLRTYPLAGITDTASRSFLYHRPRGFLGGHLFLVVLDPAVQVLRDGQELPIQLRSVLHDSTALHALRPARSTGNPLLGTGIADRRSFQVVPGQRSVALALHTPEVYTLPWRELRSLEIEAPEDEGDPGLMRISIAMGDWPVGDKYLHFRLASRRVATEALGTLALPREEPSGLLRWRQPFEVAAPRGIGRIQPGTPFWLGSNHLAAIQVDHLAPPVIFGVFTLLLVLFKVLAAHAARLSNAMLCFAAALEALVAFRLLLAYRVWAMEPFAQEAMDLALVAWSLLPWGFLVATLPPLEFHRFSLRLLSPWLPALGGWVFSLLWCRRFAGEGVSGLVWTFLHVAILAVPVLRCELPWRGVGARLWRRLERSVSWFWVWCLAPVAILVFRGLLLFFGYRESMNFAGARFSLSLIHVPLTLLFEAGYLVWLWRRIEERRGIGRRDWWPAALFVVAAWLLPAVMVSDLGLALLNLPIFLLALGSMALKARRESEEPWLSRPALVYAVPLVCLVVYLFSAATPFTSRALIKLLPESAHFELSSERNYLRLLQFAYPDELQQVARRSSEELSIMSTVMRTYTAGPIGGRGYFRSEISPHLEATALREHVPSIFVAGEWGLVGSVGLVLVFFALTTAGRSFLPWRSPDRFAPAGGTGSIDGSDSIAGGDVLATTAHLGALTFGLASIYMILANYGLALFTGRNAYLLGLDSRADVLESLTFTLLFALGAALVREEENS